MSFPGVRFRVNPDHLTDPRLEFLRSWWHRKRGVRTMPSKGDISPSELREYLSWIVVLDVMPGVDDFRYRVIGSLVTEYFLLDATGKTVREAFREETPELIREGVLEVYRWVVREKQVLRAHAEGGTLGRNLEGFSTIYLPFSDDGENVDTILSAMVFNQSSVLMARQIAKANGGRLIENPDIRKPSTLPN